MNERAICQAVYDRLLVQDLDTLTVADICRMAPVSRATFYRYFRDKTEVIEHLLDQALSRMEASTFSGRMLQLLKMIEQNRLFFRHVFWGTDGLYFINVFFYGLEQREKNRFLEDPGVLQFIMGGIKEISMSWLGCGCPESASEIHSVLEKALPEGMRNNSWFKASDRD